MLGALQSLLLTGPRLEEFLHKVAVLAADVVGPAASCGITTRYDGQPRTVASSDPRAALVDEEQYNIDEGPCIDTLQTGTIVSVPDLGSEQGWGTFSGRAMSRGYGPRSAFR